MDFFEVLEILVLRLYVVILLFLKFTVLLFPRIYVDCSAINKLIKRGKWGERELPSAHSGTALGSNELPTHSFERSVDTVVENPSTGV